jgi:hypothetical protein
VNPRLDELRELDDDLLDDDLLLLEDGELALEIEVKLPV